MSHLAENLSSSQERDLCDLLARCVVRIKAGAEEGTGFFIAPRQILTCRHVIKPAIGPDPVPISVTWYQGAGIDPREFSATLDNDPPAGWPDIAILAVPDAVDCSCVILDSSQIAARTQLLTAGFPYAAKIIFQPQGFEAGFSGLDEDGNPALRITGDFVKPGMSGSPIVSLQSGLVVGMVRLTKDEQAPAGGFGTMFADITGKFLRLETLMDRPPPATQDWIDIVGGLRLKNSGRDYDGSRWRRTSTLPRIDLIVEQAEGGPLQDWQIGVRASRAGFAEVRISCTAADLGDGVLRAVDGWSRRQVIRRQAEVRVLGEVLDRALLPAQARIAVDEDMTTPPLLLRVCVDNAGALSQLPWEYAWGHDSEPLSVNSHLAFARFADVPGVPPAPKSQLRVLAVVEMPDGESRKFAAYPDEDGRPIQPGADEFLRSVKDVYPDNGQFNFDHASNLPRDELKAKLAERWDIVHYVGFGWEAERQLVISMGCGKQGLRPTSLRDLRNDFLALAKCTVFVAEFHKPPPGREFGPAADLNAFSSLLHDDLHAVVVTRNPVDIVDMRRFNESFYQGLVKGDIVESAVQSGRSAVRDEIREGRDVTAFGSFTVTTRQAGEVRLLTRAEQGTPGVSSQAAPQEAFPADQPAAVPRVPDAAESVVLS